MDVDCLMNNISKQAENESRSVKAIECYAIGVIFAAKTKLSEQNVHKLCVHAESICDKYEPLGELF